MTDDISKEDRTLKRNSVTNFIMRIDLVKNDELNIRDIAEKMSGHFDRIEKKQTSNFRINFTGDSSDLSRTESFNFVLLSDRKTMSMTFSESQNSFWIESKKYENNSAYKEIINKTINTISSLKDDTESNRIGLRYINEFKCEKNKDINKIYGKRLSSIVKAMSKKENQIRIIGMEEYNNDDYKMRLQYGIPNNFYPSIINVFDLLFDIDSYVESACSIQKWEEVIRKLNHAAYDKFIDEINPTYIEKELR